ncbi:tyrosine-type recombinase/integrase [Sulfitobacter brevis]|nr:tyrosine-type recombinase/integrase [Sulfitobacter brevis]
MKVEYPGLIAAKMPSGNTRYLVRVAGDPNKRITLKVSPGHALFHDAYAAARCGEKYEITNTQVILQGSVSWLTNLYISHLEAMVKAGQSSPLTLKQREPFAAELSKFTSQSPNSRGKQFAGLPALIPAPEIQRYLDSLAATPGKRKNVLKFLKAMYKWGKARGYVSRNPVADITADYRSAGGATPWSLEDLEKYREVHKPGTMAHLALTLFMFTACRIGDAYWLGPKQEKRIDGVLHISWQPRKAGSSPVSVPVLPPLERAIRSGVVLSPDAYLLTAHGKPFRSPEGLRNRFKAWCIEADLGHLSSHGIRKAAGRLLSHHGATQYQIMAIHGHASSSSSQVYTADVERALLAASGMGLLADMDW